MLTFGEVPWYSRGEIGEYIRDLFDLESDPKIIVEGLQRVGLSDEEIIECLMEESEDV